MNGGTFRTVFQGRVVSVNRWVRIRFDVARQDPNLNERVVLVTAVHENNSVLSNPSFSDKIVLCANVSIASLSHASVTARVSHEKHDDVWRFAYESNGRVVETSPF